MPSEEITPLIPSTLENIDTAVYNFVNETLNLHTTNNQGRVKVPVLWLGTERAFQVKNDKALRDKVGKLKLPLITVTRTSVSRDDDFQGAYRSWYGSDPAGPDGAIVAVTKVIKQDKTRNFANVDANKKNKGNPNGPYVNKKVVYETLLIPKPTYVTCMFEIHIRTEYQQQMNDLLPSFIIDQKNVTVIEHNGYKYETFIQSDYGTTSNAANLASEERMFTAKAQFKVLGYLTGDGNEEEGPSVIRRQNVVEVKISRERVIVGDERPWAKKIAGDKGKYREF
tara:strand:- start:13670 stop:14515 length:846 start_codon:yes stop_codon:yes gene_type:complete